METAKNITAKIVVGLGYGDEGKGITTDYLCSKSDNPIVVRFSGGPQAAHTVMLDDKKHIFSNFGAGSLRGAPTYFGEHTCFYPATIMREMKKLKAIGIVPELYIHPLAKMITPFDVFANREDGQNMLNGSCGLGIGKTMERNEGPFKLHAVDLLDKDTLFEKVEAVMHFYRCEGRVDPDMKNDLLDFREAIHEIIWRIRLPFFLTDYDDIIFEGSQGILLDMDHGVFPHVTYANTTSKNAHLLLDELDIRDREMYYVTRSYATRHGNGPFTEKNFVIKNNEEETNVFNKHQGRFKIGPIDYSKLNYAIKVDKIHSWKYRKHLVVTCLDQAGEFDYSKISCYFYNILESSSPYSKNMKFRKLQLLDESI